MILFEKVYELVMDSAVSVGTEHVELKDSLNRILAQDVTSDMDIPPFNKSAMDGYACRRQDLANELTVVETIQAGQVPRKSIGENQCSKIMTGAAVPEGADCVIMVEFTEAVTDNTIRFTAEGTRDNTCLKGEDVQKGAVVLRRGARIGPQQVAVLATVGCAKPLVARRPRVGIIATGDEVVEPAVTPSPAQIRNSNSYQLWAHVLSVGAVPRYYGIAADTEGALDSALNKARTETDVVLLSGGVSVGEFDLVPKILKKKGITLIFEKIAIKPGKPTVFGVSDDVCFFGLPGNPVSTFVLFELLVKPFLFRMMGHDFQPANVSAPLEKTISRKRVEREAWLPVVFTEVGGVRTVEYHGSAHIHALCFADGLVRVPAGVAEIKQGMCLCVRQIRP